jgi:hypothetical protein
MARKFFHVCAGARQFSVVVAEPIRSRVDGPCPWSLGGYRSRGHGSPVAFEPLLE